MRIFAIRSRLALTVAAAVVVVVVALWWTKTIAFTKTAVVEFSTHQPSDGSVSFNLIDVEAAPDDLTKTAELLAQTRGGSSSDGTVTLNNQELIVVDPCSETSCSCVTHEAGGISGRRRID